MWPALFASDTIYARYLLGATKISLFDASGSISINNGGMIG
jgi:hypothetical protein